jgi:hypothetical protein
MKKAIVLSGILMVLSVPLSARAEKDRYHEVTPAISLYSGDALRALTLGGFQYSYHFTRMFWLGADFLGGSLRVDEPNGLGLTSGDRFIAVGGAVYFNVPALLGVSKMQGESGLSADLYTSIGGGHLWAGEEGEPYGFVGGGMVLHTPVEWLAVRFDLKGLFFRLSNSEGSDFNADMALTIGPSILF